MCRSPRFTTQEAPQGVGKVNAQAFRRLGGHHCRRTRQHHPFRVTLFFQTHYYLPALSATSRRSLPPVRLHLHVCDSGGTAQSKSNWKTKTGILKAVFYLNRGRRASSLSHANRAQWQGRVTMPCQRQMNSPIGKPFQALSPDEMIHVGRLAPGPPLDERLGRAERPHPDQAGGRPLRQRSSLTPCHPKYASGQG
jgi:hypothetical protein